MNIEVFRKHYLSVKWAAESISLQNRSVLVCKVMEKVFVYLPLEPQDGLFKAYLKCNLEKSVALREKYSGIIPDDFKTLLWNWVTLESDVPDELIKELWCVNIKMIIFARYGIDPSTIRGDLGLLSQAPESVQIQ